MTIEDLIALLWRLPGNAGMVSWELCHEGYGHYTLTAVVCFTLEPGQSVPSVPRALGSG